MCGLAVQDYPGKLTCTHTSSPTVHPSIPDDLTLAAPVVMLTIKQAYAPGELQLEGLCSDSFGLKEFLPASVLNVAE